MLTKMGPFWGDPCPARCAERLVGLVLWISTSLRNNKGLGVACFLGEARGMCEPFFQSGSVILDKWLLIVMSAVCVSRPLSQVAFGTVFWYNSWKYTGNVVGEG